MPQPNDVSRSLVALEQSWPLEIAAIVAFVVRALAHAMHASPSDVLASLDNASPD
jgi:hypothetical protein